MAKFNLKKYRARRIAGIATIVVGLTSLIIANPASYEPAYEPVTTVEAEAISHNQDSEENTLLASTVLERLEIKGRAPKTGYERTAFYKTWPSIDGCNLRQRILRRELGDTAKLDSDQCTVLSGEYDEPYTGAHLVFNQKSELSSGVQIDHVVALSDAWQKRRPVYVG